MVQRVIIICALLLVSAYALDVRFSGMGNLNYIFQDEFNELNLYDFAKMPAGFFSDDSFSFVSFTAAGLKEKWQMDSLNYLTYWALGQALPENLQNYAPFEALGYAGFYDIPQFDLPPGQFRYESRRLYNEYGDFGEELRPEALGVYASYSQLSKEYNILETSEVLRTPELFIVYSRPVLSNLLFGAEADGFYGMYRIPGDGIEANLKPFGGGLGISYVNGVFTLGLNGDYHYSIFDYKTISPFATETIQEFKGHAISPSIAGIVSTKIFTWINTMSYKWVSLSGTQDSDIELGDLGINVYSAKSQVLLKRDIFRFTLFGSFDSKTPEFIDNNSSVEFRTSYNSLAGVFGCGIDIPIARAGIEGRYVTNSADDEIFNTVIEGSDLALKVGVEFNLTKNLLFRCGYDYNSVDNNLDQSDDRVTSDLMTYGLGFNFIHKFKLDLAYNYKWYTFEGSTEQRVTDHALFVFMKYQLG